MSSASADSGGGRSGRKATINRECRDRLLHGPPRKGQIACGEASSDAAVKRPKSWANKKMRLILVVTKGLGCTTTSASPVKEAIYAVRLNEAKKKRRDEKFYRRTEVGRRRNRRREQGDGEEAAASHPAVAGVCCGPGILISSDAAFVDCIHSRRRPAAAVTTKQRQEVVFHFSPVFEEIPSADDDRFGEWRLDIEGMSYEELLELGDRIGFESTGLKKNEMFRCLRKAKSRMEEEMLPLLLHAGGGEWKCSICQDGYESGNEAGKLDCGHTYHIRCLKQWLRCKNSCPVCKDEAIKHHMS